MIKSILTFLTLTLITLSVFAKEPPIDSASMFDCAVYSGMAKMDNQKTYITAGIFLYDNANGVKAWSTWSNSPEGLTWINSRKATTVAEINEWGVEGKEVTMTNFLEKVQGCDIRYGIIDKKSNLRLMGMKLGYIKDPMAGELPGDKL